MQKFLWILVLSFTSSCTFHFTATEKVSGPIPKKYEKKYGVVTGKVFLITPSWEDHKIEVFRSDGRKIGEVPINNDGIYRIELPPGEYLLKITPGDDQRYHAEIVKGKTRQLDLPSIQ